MKTIAHAEGGAGVWPRDAVMGTSQTQTMNSNGFQSIPMNYDDFNTILKNNFFNRHDGTCIRRPAPSWSEPDGPSFEDEDENEEDLQFEKKPMNQAKLSQIKPRRI